MDRDEMQDIAKLEVREYFDQFLNVALPRILKAERHYMHMTIEAHDAADTAHKGVERRFSKTMWLAMGLMAGGGGTIGGLIAQAARLIG